MYSALALPKELFAGIKLQRALLLAVVSIIATSKI